VHVAPAPRHCPAGSTQTPFTQEFVQQFASEPQTWLTGLHVAGGTQVPVQARLQQSLGAEQAVPFASHAGNAPHAPFELHWLEQHSFAAEQSAPSLLHVSAAPQKPLGHEPEQHSDAATHAPPSWRHASPSDDRWRQAAPESATRHSTSAVNVGRRSGVMGSSTVVHREAGSQRNKCARAEAHVVHANGPRTTGAGNRAHPTRAPADLSPRAPAFRPGARSATAPPPSARRQAVVARRRGTHADHVRLARGEDMRGARVFVGVGSSIDPAVHVERALARLRREPGVAALSTLYRTPALGRPADPPFVNGVVEVRDALPAAELKSLLARIEEGEGRRRGADRFAPRTLDLDLLLWGDLVSRAPDLPLPHPDVSERRFVAIPLLELAPGLVLPGSGSRLAELVEAMPPHPMEPAPDLTRALRRRIEE
jgi:2-amino-4-hydroxy-6-hydroxymethyldihydropteridine diphosphokinase